MNAAEILARLVAIPTPSAVSNLALLDWVEDFLAACNWRSTRFGYTDDAGVPKANLIARPGAVSIDAPIDLAFVCHTDTVPYAASWATALELRNRDGQLHGCGAADVKGALACFLAAIQQQDKDRGPSAGTALILTADEEVGCKGMERLLAEVPLRIGAAIVSEPTSLHPGIAGKGYGLARVTVTGIEAHSAYPAEGLSAIAVAARFLHHLDDLSAEFGSTDPLFDPPRTTLNVGTIQGGSAKNIIPGCCTFLVEWRPIPADPARSVFAQLEWIADSIHVEEPRARIHVEPQRAESGFGPAASGTFLPRLAAAQASLGMEPHAPIGISFGSEASRVARVADEVIILGPGDMHTAHSERESVPLAELEQWTALLRALLA